MLPYVKHGRFDVRLNCPLVRRQCLVIYRPSKCTYKRQGALAATSITAIYIQ